jgi:L-threonylcarbamoyladenylate synthase
MSDTPVIDILNSRDYDGEIDRAAARLNAGGVVVVPTETVYGAAAVLTQSQAVERLRSLRQQRIRKPLTVHLADPNQARDFVGPLSQIGERMLHKLWPGPVALLFEVAADRQREVATV